MLTDEQYPFFAQNRIVTKEDLADYFLEYFQNSLSSLHESILYPQGGLFQSISLTDDGADKFKMASFPSPTGMAGGRILDTSNHPTAGYTAGVQFENALGIDYHVAIGKSLELVGVDVSPKDGKPRIKYLKESLGSDPSNPDAVVDNLDGTLTLTVDTVTEAAVSNAGRKVLVFQLVLADGATSEALAWQECTVAWDGSNNKITTVDTPAGAGYFGQTIPSTTAADYFVVLRGLIVKRNTDLSTDSSLAYLGTVKGAGAGNVPTVFDITGQIVFGTGGISDLWQITRTENVPPNRLKIDVKAIAAEEGSGISQIRVSGWDGVGGAKTVFDVDELGNVAIEGDLTVQGETTQEDLVTVNASEIITDALTLGDHDTNDSHLIKGIWTHKDATETDTWFVVDGANSGHVGIGVAAHATYHLNVGSGGIQTDGHVYPSGSGKFMGNVGAQRWHSVRAYAVISCEADSEADEDLFYCVKGNVRCDGDEPKYVLSYALADHVDERHWAMETVAEGEFGLVSYNGARDTRYQFLVAQKTADAYTVDALSLNCVGILSINGGTSVSIDAGSANVVIQAGGIVSITAPVECGDKFKVSDVAGEGVNGNFSPSAVQTYALGNWSFTTDTGYRWAGVFSADFFAVKEGGMPGYGWRNHLAAADEKHWTFYIDSGNDLVLETRTDTPPGEGTGVSILKVTRGAGTAVTQIDIYKPTYMGATIFTQTVAPVTQHNYYVGSYGGEFLEVNAKDIVASHTGPRVIWRETDQSNDRANWGMIASGGDLLIGTYNFARSAMVEAMHIYRDAGDVTSIKDLDFLPYIRSYDTLTTSPFTITGVTGKTFHFDLFSFETGLGTNEGRWRFTTTDDGAGDFIFQTVTSATAWSGNNVFRVARLSGTNVGGWYSYVAFVPATDGDLDLGAISPGSLRWQHGYINRPVIEKRTIVNTGDAGTEGMITFDNNYIYCCIGTNSWARVAIATW